MEKPTVKFKFVKDKDYRRVYSNSIWANTTPKGELQLDFCFDTAPSPLETIHSVEGGALVGDENKELRKMPAEEIEKLFQVGVIISIHEARNFLNFLTSFISEAESALRSNEPTR